MPWFEYWLSRAKQGDEFATSIMWSSVRDAVKKRQPCEEQWVVLDRLLAAMKDRKTAQAVNRALSLGRRPGRRARYTVEEDRFARATAVFDRIGIARGEELADACAEVLTEMGIGVANSADIRSTMKAYRDYLPLLLEMRDLPQEHARTRDKDSR